MSINTQLQKRSELTHERVLASAYMFPEPVNARGQVDRDIFVFQYYPDNVSDTYNPEYATKQVPSGSHPLYQWVGGTGRDVTFTARFTAELDRGDVRGKRGGLFPSDRYTVDVRAALSRLRSFMMADYGNQQGSGISSRAKPPKKLHLTLEGLGLAANGEDTILVIVRSAPITYESAFPNGHPRIVEVSMTCSQIVQRTSAASGGSAIQFIGREGFEADGRHYKYKGTVDRALGV